MERWLAERGAARRVVDIGPYVFAGGEAVERLRFRWPRPGASAGGAGGPGGGDRAGQRRGGRADAGGAAVGGRRGEGARCAAGDEPAYVPACRSADCLGGHVGPMRGAIIGAALLEGLADDPDDAVRRAEAGEFEFAPGHERGALGPMVGVISPSMPVWVVENASHGNRAYCNFSEGYGEVLRFGAYGRGRRTRCAGWADAAPILAPRWSCCPRRSTSAPSTPTQCRWVTRCTTATAPGRRWSSARSHLAFWRWTRPSNDVAEVAGHIADQRLLLPQPEHGERQGDCRLCIGDRGLDDRDGDGPQRDGVRPAHERDGRALVHCAGGEIRGLFRPGYRPEDANPDVGDSTITETIGLGGFAMAASPAITQFAGITRRGRGAGDADMYKITWTESVNYRIPALGFRGTPLGIDCRKVVETGIVPIVNTGIAHREPGVGVIGGGIVEAPPAALCRCSGGACRLWMIVVRPAGLLMRPRAGSAV